jgi:Flp pilus assembly pilin Flp
MWWRPRTVYDVMRKETGASLPEYALLLGLIVIVCLAALTALGNTISSFCAGLAASV